MFYTIGLILSIGIMIFQIRAAQSVTACGPALPKLWGTLAVSQLFFALDSIPRWGYVIYFGGFFIVMAIAASIVWQKVQR
jgi:hypothetical protein